MVDHSWLIATMRDIQEYAVRNSLRRLVPVVKAACAAVEEELKNPGKADWRHGRSTSEADTELAIALDRALHAEEDFFLSQRSLKRLSGRARR